MGFNDDEQLLEKKTVKQMRVKVTVELRKLMMMSVLTVLILAI